VPLSQLGINVTAGLNADRSEADDAAIWETVKQRSEPFREKIQYELLDRWQAVGVKVTLIFDYPEFDDRAPLFEAVAKSVNAAITNDERRNILGLEPLEDELLGKAIYIHSSLVRIDEEPVPEVPAPPPMLPSVATQEETEVIEGKARIAESFGTLRGRVTKKWEKRFQAVIDRVLREQRDHIIERSEHIARKPSDTSSWWNPKRENERLLRALDDALTEFGREVVSKSRGLARVTGVAKAEPMMYETILNDLKREAGARITNINETTRDAVRQTIADHLTGGENLDPSPTGLAGLIRGATMQNGQPVFGEYRSELISRTESAHLYNQATLGTYRELGVEHVDAVDGDHDAACAARNGKRFLASEAAGISDHPNGTLDWVPVVNEDRRRSTGEEDELRHGRYSSFDEFPPDVRERYGPGGYNDFNSRLGDQKLSTLTDAQGFNARPQVVSDAELSRFVKRGEMEFYRGVSKQAYADSWLTGNTIRHGSGYYGNGTYTAVGRGIKPTGLAQMQGRVAMNASQVAETFAYNEGVVMRGTLRSNARVLEVAGKGTEVPELNSVFSNLTKVEREMDSLTHVAAARGYDAVLIKGAERIGLEVGGDQLIILNRGAVRMSSAIKPARSTKVVLDEARAAQ
jgi:hypothetical protein